MNIKESYTILGLEEHASVDDIKNAYRKLAKQYHPDKTEGDEYLTNMFRRIKMAYDNLISSRSTHQNNTHASNSSNTYQKKVILDSNIENWINNHHLTSEYLDNCKKQLNHLQKKVFRKHLSLVNIMKLSGIAFLIVMFFYPYTEKAKTTQKVATEQLSWKTISETHLFSVPDKNTVPLTIISKAQLVDSLDSTKYFLKVNVTAQDSTYTGYILKSHLIH